MKMEDMLDDKTIERLKQTVNNPENVPETSIDRKIDGAIAEVSRRAELDKTIEDNLSTGLDTPDFNEASEKINERRNELVMDVKSELETKREVVNTESALVNSVLDDKFQIRKELEAEITDPFNKFVYDKLGKMNKVLLLDYLMTSPLNKEERKIIHTNVALDYKYDVIVFSDNGYLMQLTHKDEIESVWDVKSEKAKYNLIAPDGTVLLEDKDYEDVYEALESMSDGYLKSLKEEFDQTENGSENDTETPAVIEGSEEEESAVNNTNNNIEEVSEISEASKEELKPWYDEIPEANPEISKADENLDSWNNVQPAKFNQESENGPESEIEIELPLDKGISSYAESIGINPKKLAANLEFVFLAIEQQQFVLETLRRSSLAKAKVEGHESFVKEKASKAWWKIGFALNQNYHKERHEIEAVKNIESRGLEGYGEGELNWLIEVVKSGPETRTNRGGEIVVDCLSENYFDEGQRETVAEYNRVAREYIETSKSKISQDLQEELEYFEVKLLDSAKDDNKRKAEINNLLIRSKNNINLLKFLSADKETEKLLDKMAETSFSGLNKVKGMAGAQKDKAGYAALGFTLRTGTKFALANSACLANAISYAVGPMVAAIVGGFRGHNLGKKELIEREELAKLGVKDQSGITKNLNLVTGKKNSVNFGLTEKLQNLIDELKEETREEEIKKIKEKLNLRIEYTENKIDSESIDYGTISERNYNYFNLINTVAEAKSLIGKSAVNINSYWLSDGKEKPTAEKLNGEQPGKLNEISVHDRLASFLNYKEKKQNKKELNFLIKKTATGAVMGATFAAAGAFVAEQLGVANWLSEHNPVKTAEKGAGAIKNIIPSKNTNVAETIANSKANSSIDAGAVVKSDNVTAEQAVLAKSATPKVAKFVDEISNKGLSGKSDSVWRSTREIFKNNAEALGYKGDLNDQSAINNWAETQTANTISRSGEINDKIFEGNKVSLVKDEGHFKVVVEQAQGRRPGQLSHEVKSSIRRVQNLKEGQIIKSSDEPVVENSSSEPEAYNSPETLIVNDSSLVSPENNQNAILNQFHFKPEDLQQKENGFVYNKGIGQVLFNNKNGKIELVFTDNNGSTIPESFINEVAGKPSSDKFASLDLDKIFKTWNKLSNDDRSLYQLLGKKLTSSELIYQIKNRFKLDYNVWITSDNKFGVQTGPNKNEYFDLNFKDIKKMLNLK